MKHSFIVVAKGLKTHKDYSVLGSRLLLELLFGALLEWSRLLSVPVCHKYLCSLVKVVIFHLLLPPLLWMEGR